MNQTCLLVCWVLYLAVGPVFAEDPSASWEWPSVTPSAVGLDADALAAFDADIGRGQYGYVDSMLVIRNGKIAFERYYDHDYAQVYQHQASQLGPLVVGNLTGPYNYFSAWWHPYYQKGSLHTMQSVTKSVAALIVGIAVGRNDFPDIDTPVLTFFESEAIAHADERKRAMTIRHLLTMSTGLDWNEDLPYTDPLNSWTALQKSADWVQYTINQPMAHAPGEVFRYNSGATLILAHIFNLTTGMDMEEYAVEHLFRPLHIEHFWKRTPTGLLDAQEGLYLSARDLAKIMVLVMDQGRWDGQQLVPASWIEASVTPQVPVTDDGSWAYGYKWWLHRYRFADEERLAIMGSGYGGQIPFTLPELDLVVVFTGWNTLPEQPALSSEEAIRRILDAVTTP